MSSDHTKGKLVAKIGYSSSITPHESLATYYRIRAGAKLIALVPHAWPDSHYPFSVVDARRLVACWNACDSIDTRHLEKYGLPDFAEKISDLREQRDKLLDKLKQLADMDITVHGLAGVQRVANAAIAEFEGRAS